jgi:hypothetical protein
MKSLYLAQDPFVPGIHCDGVHVCTPPENEPSLATLFPGLVCEMPGSIPCPPGLNCAAYYSGTVTQAQWDLLCTASLLPQVSDIYCVVWGP